MKRKKLLIITGPTAVGKTDFAIHAASEFDGEIISCDSMQVYRHMDIGTAKASKDERKTHPHHLIDIVDPEEDFSAARYAELALNVIDETSCREKLPVVCGGTGLYIDGLLYEMEYGGSPGDPKIRNRLEEELDTRGELALHEELKKRDPEAARKIHPNNVKRMIRALERLETGEKSIKPFSSARTPREDMDPLLIGLSRPRDELYERINARVDRMMKKGLENEVKALMDMGLTPENPSMLGIGYKELYMYLQGGSSLEEAVDRIKSGTRHYAKRQFTWFKRYDTMKWINISEYKSDEEAMEIMDNMIVSWLHGDS